MPSLLHISTPENVAVRYRLAGPAQRWRAFLADCLIQMISLLFLATITAVMMNSLGFHSHYDGIWVAEVFVVFWGYHIFFEVFSEGQTPGKRQYHLRVVTENGDRLTAIAAILRNLLRIIDFLPFGFVTGFLAMLFTSRFQRLGDLVARTVVIRAEDEAPNPW